MEQLGFAMIPSWPSRSCGIDLRDDQRDVGVHAPRRRVVDDRCAAGHRGRGELARRTGSCREERDVDALERGLVRFADLVGLAVDRQHPAGRSLRGEQPQFPNREFTFVQDLDHRPADDAGGADDCDGEVSAVHRRHGSARTYWVRARREYSGQGGRTEGWRCPGTLCRHGTPRAIRRLGSRMERYASHQAPPPLLERRPFHQRVAGRPLER